LLAVPVLLARYKTTQGKNLNRKFLDLFQKVLLFYNKIYSQAIKPAAINIQRWISLFFQACGRQE